jgi:putative ABC transport system ATP-binding protein
MTHSMQAQPDPNPGARRAESADIEAIAWLLENLELEAGRTRDRSGIHRAVNEAVSAWPGAPTDHWWRWLVEAGETLGLKCRAVDCTLEQLWEIVRGGGRAILGPRDGQDWSALSEVRGRKGLRLQPWNTRARQWITFGRLRSEQFGDAGEDVVRCIVVEPRLTGDDDPHHDWTPVGRVLALLRPESNDIWIVLLFSLVVGLLALATPLAIEALVGTVTFGRLLQPIVVLSVMLLTFLSFQAAIRGLQTYVVEIIQRRLFARVTADLSWRLPRIQHESLDGRVPRELVNRFFEVVTLQKITSQLLLDGLSVILNTLIGMAVLGFYHPWLLGFDVVLLALIAFAILVLGRGAVATSIKESKVKYHVAAWLEDLASCGLSFRYDGGPEFAQERTDNLTYDYLTARRRHFRVLLRQIIFALGLQAVASTVLLGLGGWLVIDGQLTLGQLVAAELIVTVIVSSFAKLGKHMEAWYDLLASVDKLGYLLDLPVEKHAGLLSGLGNGPAEVVLHGVEYQYTDRRAVLARTSVQIPPGARAVVSGLSGSGKSVLLDLLFGLRSPSSGYVTIDGCDPRELRPDILRRSLALVREIEIFEGTIAENVHLERPDVTTGDVRAALAKVLLLDDLLRLPQGLESEVNSTGYPLSPTQQRKLMLARALAGRPTLVLIDGTLDALPDDDLEQISGTLWEPHQNWTLLVVTGRRMLLDQATHRIELSRVTTPAGGVEVHTQEARHAH